MGRHRRDVSNSTVATVDTTRTRWLPETAILKPLPASMYADSDSWPCFVLTDATVYLKDGKRMANPLLPDFPFVVRGKLEVDGRDEDQRAWLVDHNVQSGYVEIQGATMYSISYGPVAVWVAGVCGWFEISPSPQFEETYNQMREAIGLYYEILEVFELHKAELKDYQKTEKSKKKRMREPTVDLDEVLFKYAVAVGDGMYRHEAEERCHKWATFLINHFPKEKDFAWSGTFFYTWIIDKHPDIYKDHLKKVAAEAKWMAATGSKVLPPVQMLPPIRSMDPPSRASSVKSKSKSTRTRNQSVDTDVDMTNVPSASPPALARPSSSRKTKVSQSPAGTPQPLPAKVVVSTPQISQNLSPAPTSQSTPTTEGLSPVDFLVQTLEEAAAASREPIDRIPLSAIRAKMYFACRINTYDAVPEIIAYYSKDLVQRLDPKWHPSPFWGWLLEQSKKTTTEFHHTTVEKLPYQLTRRKKKTMAAPRVPQPKLEIRTLPRQPSADEDEDSSDDMTSSHPRHAGKGGLRLHSASKKRPAPESPDDDTNPGRRGRKSAKTTNYYTNPYPDLEGALDNDSASDAASPQTDVDDSDVNGTDVPPPRDAVRVVIHAEKLPSMSPSGPNGTWCCDQEDCGYVVRAAEEAAGKKLVQQHFRDHESQTEKVELAVTEAERRGRMPINHLLEKIQKMGKDSISKDREFINGQEVPKPIKRRLIV